MADDGSAQLEAWQAFASARLRVQEQRWLDGYDAVHDAAIEAWDAGPTCEVCGDVGFLPHPDGDDEPCPFCPRLADGS